MVTVIVTLVSALALLLATCLDVFAGTGVCTCMCCFGTVTKSRRKKLLKRAFVLRWLVCCLLAISITITAINIASMDFLTDSQYRNWLVSFLISNTTTMSPVLVAMVLNICVHGGIEDDTPTGVEATAVTTTTDAI